MEQKKIILITGVTGGIGSAISSFFKKKGYTVYGTDQFDEIYSEDLDFYIKIDLNKFSSDNEYRKQIENELNDKIQNLNALVNNAAVQKLGAFEEIQMDDWQYSLNVNVTAPLFLSKILLPRLISNSGSIVNIGSIHNQLTKPNFVSYATSKSALIGLTKSMAVDLKNKVKVNAISPAAIETDMLRAGFDNNEKSIQNLKDLHPTQSIGSPLDVAELCYYLIDNKNAFLHGANITLDGGISSVLHDLKDF